MYRFIILKYIFNVIESRHRKNAHTIATIVLFHLTRNAIETGRTVCEKYDKHTIRTISQTAHFGSKDFYIGNFEINDKFRTRVTRMYDFKNLNALLAENTV